MVQKLKELCIDLFFFPITSVIKCNLFWMMEQISMLTSVLSLKLLLDGYEFSECWWNNFDQDSWEEVPKDCGSWSFPTEDLGQLIGEEYDIKNWLRDIKIKMSQRMCPKLNILSQSLIWVCNSWVQIAYFVIEHLSQIWWMEMVCHILTESYCQELLKIVHARVDTRRGNGVHQQNANSVNKLLKILFDNSLDDSSIDISEPYTHLCSQHK